MRLRVDDALAAAADFFRRTMGALQQNLTLGLLAMGSALAIWVFVTDQENPTTIVDVTPAVRVTAVNIPEDLAVVGLTEPILIRASAPRDIALRLNGDDFRATVNLDGLTLGHHEVPVRVEHVGSGRHVRVIQLAPGRVSVGLQPLQTRVVSVRAELFAQPPLGYEADPQIILETTSVRVSGPSDLVDRVAEAVARIDLSRATKDVNSSIPLTVTNGAGTTIEGVSLEPDSVRYRVGISQTLFERSYAVSPRMKGNPAPGYTVASLTVDPTTIILQGTLSVLDRIEAVQTEEVEIGNAIADVSQAQVRLLIPSGARLKTGPPTVQVRIRITPSTSRAVFGVPATLEGVDSGLQARSLVPIVEIEVEGTLPQLRTLGPSSFVAAANLAGQSLGRHDVQIEVRTPPGIKVTAIKPERITVEVFR